MLYCDMAERLFTDIEEAFDYYYESDENIPELVPEHLYGTEQFQYSNNLPEELGDILIEHIDENVYELNFSENFQFSEQIGVDLIVDLYAHIQTWLNKVTKGVLQPNYIHEIPFREAYREFYKKAEK